MSKKRFSQGYYTPLYPDKYIGDINNIRYMSSWELQFDRFVDGNPNILRWSSEEIAIKYFHPIKRKICNYYPDYWLEYRNARGVVHQEIVEVKPKAQTRQTRAKKPKNRTYQQLEFAINTAKWQACKQFCDGRNITFSIMTEDDIFGK